MGRPSRAAGPCSSSAPSPSACLVGFSRGEVSPYLAAARAVRAGMVVVMAGVLSRVGVRARVTRAEPAPPGPRQQPDGKLHGLTVSA